jgi:DNA-binding Xre family transcriptional regulator
VRGVRFSTLLGICRVLQCKPGDLLDIEEDDQA